MQPTSDYTDVETVARAYGVSNATVRNWCRSGAIPGAIEAGRQWRIPGKYAKGGIPIILPNEKGRGDRHGN